MRGEQRKRVLSEEATRRQGDPGRAWYLETQGRKWDYWMSPRDLKGVRSLRHQRNDAGKSCFWKPQGKRGWGFENLKAVIVGIHLLMEETLETPVWSLGQEDPLEKGMATHSSILAWRIPWAEEPGGPQSTGSQRVRHNGAGVHSSFGQGLAERWSLSMRSRERLFLSGSWGGEGWRQLELGSVSFRRFPCASPECSDFSCSVIFPVEPYWPQCCLLGQDLLGPNGPQLLTQLPSATRAKVLQGVSLNFFGQDQLLFLYFLKLLWLHVVALLFTFT